MDKKTAWIIDIETYPNVFLFAVVRGDGKHKNVFEVSDRLNEMPRILACMKHLEDNKHCMVSFNGVGFDYPILHQLIAAPEKLPKTGKAVAAKVWKLAQKQIDSFKDGGFGNTIKADEVIVKQMDLYRIWHFNNKAKATSLKLLEFNMKMDNIEDLPFEVGTELNHQQIDELKAYNLHDITATLRFFDASQEQIDFRLDLGQKYGKDWINCDDTKIGAEYFAMRLEEAGVKLKEYKDGKLVMRQTKRDRIKIADCLFDYYDFKRPEFIAVMNWFKAQVITETKGVFSDIEEHDLGEVAKYAVLETKRKKFKAKPTDDEIAAFKKEHPLGWIEEEELKATEYALDANGEFIMEYPTDEDGSPDLTKKPKKKRIPKKSYWGCWRVAETLNVVLDGFRFDFGTGGIHGSVENKVIDENSSYQIIDADVSSMYPNLAISNNVYPEHLSSSFCDIYKDMYEQRKNFPKGSAENGMLKLALNGTYGKSNDKYSIFYDPMFTMKITINGQLSLCLLAEKLLEIPKLKIIQVNTDGITVALLRRFKEQYNSICSVWQQQVKLDLEFVDYSRMIIRDVNNYISLYTNGKVKRKGAYQYEGLGWHQNQGGLIIPMAAEAEMLHGILAREFIEQKLQDPESIWDFMLRTKVPRNSKLVLVMPDGTEVKQQNVCRYYVSNEGGKLVKIMPPLEEGGEERRLSIEAAWTIQPCNNLRPILANPLDIRRSINVDYYATEAEKLVIRREPKEPSDSVSKQPKE